MTYRDQQIDRLERIIDAIPEANKSILLQTVYLAKEAAEKAEERASQARNRFQIALQMTCEEIQRLWPEQAVAS